MANGSLIVSRAEWEARPPRSQSQIPLPTPELWLHHSASEQHGPEGMRAIQAYHMGTKGWADIAYSFCVDDDGTIYEGRGAGIAGGHTRGHNRVSHAICALGNYENRPPPDALIHSLAVLADHGRRKGWWGAISGGHRDVGQTACPGRHLYARIHDIRALSERTIMPDDPVYKVDSPVVAACWHPTGKFVTVVTRDGGMFNLMANEDPERSGDDPYLGRVVYSGT